jgi:hypothetical protein
MRMFGENTLGKVVRLTRVHRKGKQVKTYRDVIGQAKAIGEAAIPEGDLRDSFLAGRPVKRMRWVGGVKIVVEYLADHRPHGKGVIEKIDSGITRFRPEVVRGGIVL